MLITLSKRYKIVATVDGIYAIYIVTVIEDHKFSNNEQNKNIRNTKIQKYYKYCTQIISHNIGKVTILYRNIKNMTNKLSK